MVKKTTILLDLYEQQRKKGHDPSLAEDLKHGVEDEIEREDHRLFYGDETGEQLKPIVGRMLKGKSSDYEEKVRDGAKGTRG